MSSLPPDALRRAAALYEAKRLDEASALCERILAERPGGDVLHLAGLVAFEQGAIDRGIDLLRRALDAGLRHPSVHANLAICLVTAGDVTGGLEQANAALSLSPTWIPAYAALADACMAMGAVGEAVTHLRRALRLEPSPKIHSNFLYALNFLPGSSRAEIAEEHRAFGRAHSPPVFRLAGHENPPDPERRLRVGYLSADLRNHSVAYFLAPLLEAHDRNAVEVFGVASVKRPDAMTARLKSFCDGWIDIAGRSDDEAALAIRDAGIDILVELGGHTGESRLLVAARRPAPLQFAWLGYPNTAGLDALQSRFTDAFADPEGESDRHHVESLVRLPGGFLCYEPPEGVPDLAPPPCLARGSVTFGSFNTLAKISSKTIELWARVLQKVPGSRLFLKSAPLADPGVRAHVAEQFAAQGIEESRLLLEGRTRGQLGHLERYADVDIALDPFPYNGTTTTCEALVMGVPVVCMEGDRHASRVTASILRRVGLDAFVATKQKQYVSIAADLAKSPARLEKLRAEQRDKLEASPLFDRKNFARSVEVAYRQAWAEWCRRRHEEARS